MSTGKDLVQLNAEIQERKDRVENIDFKMVTFSLAGKEYGVDILSVKEIAKADKFTYVPNTASFIRGVYNLRGDIIPIIDFRTFFQIPKEKKKEGADNLENMLIFRVNDQVYGTIVDKIDKVVGINSEAIQPPHPIFGDINIKYISGVVENQGTLYIILDVVRIFSVEEDKSKNLGKAAGGDAVEVAPVPVASAVADSQARASLAAKDSSIVFIKEGLAALRRFIITDVNQKWLQKRFSEWSVGKSGDDLQLQNGSEADSFLKGFLSPCTGQFWDEDYAATVTGVLPDIKSARLNVWNIGCGKGYETYSFACILKKRYPEAAVKIWANDNDILSISQAPNLIVDIEEVPEYCREFLVKGSGGYSFDQAIKDAIVFEYRDILNENHLPELDVVLARDIISYLPEQDQIRTVNFFIENLKSGGIVFVGSNEELSQDNWRPVSSDLVSAYLHNG
ncbi:MAG: chemotaxis protein CheW [Spirochaetes bacterium]|nr:chemotaxis protein CheW [Spirochaetota bacterium]